MPPAYLAGYNLSCSQGGSVIYERYSHKSLLVSFRLKILSRHFSVEKSIHPFIWIEPKESLPLHQPAEKNSLSIFFHLAVYIPAQSAKMAQEAGYHHFRIFWWSLSCR